MQYKYRVSSFVARSLTAVGNLKTDTEQRPFSSILATFGTLLPSVTGQGAHIAQIIVDKFNVA
jgi:hypothetical protein